MSKDKDRPTYAGFMEMAPHYIAHARAARELGEHRRAELWFGVARCAYRAAVEESRNSEEKRAALLALDDPAFDA